MRKYEDLKAFLQLLFRPEELIEVRPIRVWEDRAGHRHSRALRYARKWLTADSLLEQSDVFRQLNRDEDANIFFGVNPRVRRGGRKQDVHACRTIWTDMDDVTPEVALWRCTEVGLPSANIVIDSGYGVHVYWLLDSTVDVTEPIARQRFESLLRAIYDKLDCDATQDVNRLLRLPTFWNVKRSVERKPQLCRVIRMDDTIRYPVRRFTHFAKNDPSTTRMELVRASSSCYLEVAHIVAWLDADVRDRSRRDFKVVCSLLRAGLSREEIQREVAGRSKFGTRGSDYFDNTFQNAVQATCFQ